MTDKELQTLAQTFAEETNNDLNHKDFAEAFGMKFLQWLTERFAIVKKSDIKRYYKVDKCTIRDHKKRCGDKAQTRAVARIRLCESLFGSELFNETEQ